MLHRSKPTASRIGVAAFVASALMLASCGGDDDADSAPTATEAEASAPATPPPAEPTTPATQAATTEAPQPSPTEPPTTEAAAPSSAPASTSAGLEAEVQALLDKNLDFPGPTDPVDPGTHDVAVVTAGLASSGPARVAEELVKAFAAAGWTAPDAYDGKFTPTEQDALIQKAVQDEADVIFLVAITPNAVASGVAAAQTANIPIICILCGPEVPEGTVSVEADAVAAGEGQAKYAVLNSEPDATIFVYQNTEFASSTVQSASAAAKVKELCPGCTVETPSLLLADARTAGAPIWTSLLGDRAEGELDWVILPFDSPSAALAQTAQQLGRSDFGIIGFGALSPFVDMVGAGEPVTARASLAIATPYYAWAAVDQAARVLAGQETWDSAAMPIGLITTENFASYEPGQPYVYPSFDYETEFPELWGK